MELSGPGSHLDHFIRQTRVHHVQLSSMADVKANMMLTISALIITFSIGHLTNPRLRWPVGHFMNLQYEEYARLMEGVMSDWSRVYEAQVREVYELGVFLGRKKYVYVRLAYLFFIVGLLASVAVFVGIEILAPPR